MTERKEGDSIDVVEITRLADDGCPHADKRGKEPERVRDCCPVCGYQFPEVKQMNVCPKHTGSPQAFTKDELITEDDDCVYHL